MDDTFSRIKRLRKRLKKLEDQDLVVLENAVAVLSSATAQEGWFDSIFDESREGEWDMLSSAARSISEILSDGDIDWKRRDFWSRMNVLGFVDSDEYKVDYSDASPPPELLKRLVETPTSVEQVGSESVSGCVELMLHDGLVEAWVEIDVESRREGVTCYPLPDRPESRKFFYAAERHVLRMKEKDGNKSSVVIDDWWKVVKAHFQDDVNVAFESVPYAIEIDGNRYHVMGGDAKFIIDKFGIQDLESPRTSLDQVEKALKG